MAMATLRQSGITRHTTFTQPLRCTLAVALLALSAGTAQAQAWPAKPLRMIVPFTPGGTTDVIARPLSQKLAESLGQPVVIDYKPGANTLIGAEALAKSAPDGYTLLLAAGSTVFINPAVYKSLPYDVQRDFQSVAEICSYAQALITRPGFAPNNVKEILALAKTQPGKVTYASTGNGSPAHLGGALMELLAGVKMTHVPYKGAAQATADVVGDQVDFIMTGLAPIESLIRARKVKLLALAGASRIKEWPDLPTIAETLPGYWLGTVYTLQARAGTPRPIIDRLNAETVKAIRTKEVRGPLEIQGYEVPMETTPESTSRRIAEELVRWTRLAKEANIRLD